MSQIRCVVIFLSHFYFLVDLMFFGLLQYGRRPVHIASVRGHLEIVRFILDRDPQQLSVADKVCSNFSITL